MVTQILTHLSVATRPGKRGNVYRSPRIYLPTKLTEDSAFPFREGEKIVVRVVGEKMIVEGRKAKVRRRVKKR